MTLTIHVFSTRRQIGWFDRRDHCAPLLALFTDWERRRRKKNAGSVTCSATHYTSPLD